MAKKPVRRIISQNPENMTTGRPDDFNGEITLAAARWFESKNGAEMVVTKVYFKPDDGDEFSELYFVGFEAEKYFRPSLDGIEPIEFDAFDKDDEHSSEGPFWIPILGEDDEPLKARMSQSSMWGFFLTHLRDAGFDITLIDGDEGLGALTGIRGHFNRIEQPKKSGSNAETDGKKRDNRVLVMTELEQGKKSSKAGAKSAKSSKPAAEETDTDSDDDGMMDKLQDVITAALSAAPKSSLPVQRLTTKVISNYKGPRKDEAIKSVEKALAAMKETVKYDKKNGTATLIATEQEDDDTDND